MSNRPDHVFVRHADPAFGIRFGGGCGEQVDGITCGWPEPFHPQQLRPEPSFQDKLDRDHAALGGHDQSGGGS